MKVTIDVFAADHVQVNKRAKRRLAMSQVETDESESEESEPSSGNEDSD